MKRLKLTDNRVLIIEEMIAKVYEDKENYDNQQCLDAMMSISECVGNYIELLMDKKEKR